VKKGEHGKQNLREEKKENHEEVSMTRVKRREGKAFDCLWINGQKR